MPDPDVNALRHLAAASDIDLTDDRAEALVVAIARHRSQMTKLDRLDLTEREPGIADPSAGR
jgi:hypothetical protein